MKKIVTSGLISLSLIGGMAMSYAAEMKLGTVDYVSTYQKVPQGQQSLEKLKTDMQPQVDALAMKRKAIETKMMDFQKNSATMTKSDMLKTQQALVAEQQAFQQEVMQLRQSEAHREQYLSQLFHSSLNEAIAHVGKKGSYTMILNSQAAPYVGSDANVTDVTPSVIKYMISEQTSK